MKRIQRRLVIFSGVSHYPSSQGVLAHRGFVREVDIWGRIFEEVCVVTRRGSGRILADAIPYTEKNIQFSFLPAPDNTDGFMGKLKLLFYASAWVWSAVRLLKPGDVLMARGPDSIGFLGFIASMFGRWPRFAKYADQWENFPGEPLGYRLQKYFYRSPSFGGPVMIYGASDSRHPNWVPFFTSGVSTEEWMRAAERVKSRQPPPPYRLLFAGRLVYFKGADILLQALVLLNQKRHDIVLDLVGDGPERPRIEALIQENQLDNVNLYGWLGPEDLAQRYAQAHIFIHPSRKEGFGKVLIEAMSYGLPIIGADVGVSQELLARNRCGGLFKKDDFVALAEQIERLLSSPALQAEFTQNGQRVSQELVLENLESRYWDFVQKHLHLSA